MRKNAIDVTFVSPFLLFQVAFVPFSQIDEHESCVDGNKIHCPSHSLVFSFPMKAYSTLKRQHKYICKYMIGLA